MGLRFIVFIGLITIVLAQSSSPEWEQYKINYSKIYEAEEEQRRMAIFLANLKAISDHNELFDKGIVSYKLKVNSYGDLASEEFLRVMTGLNALAIKKAEISEKEQEEQQNADANLPESIDWREQGAVTEIKNQGSCGSCVAFSTTGSLEGQYYLKTGKLVSLSEQNIVDCTNPPGGGDKCSGRQLRDGIEWVKNHGGIETEQEYPYMEKPGTCKYNKAKLIAPVQSAIDIPMGDEKKLQEAIATVGPVSVAFHSTVSFQFYSSGIFYEKNCDPLALNHAMTAVGYGSDEKGTEYYIVKNSWGKLWGENGYLKMARNRDNNCGIATAAFYPVL